MQFAGRNFVDEQALEIGIQSIFCKATYAGATPLTISNAGGRGVYQVSLTAAGTYKIELENKFVALRSFKVELLDSTARDFTFQIKEYDLNPTSGLAYITFYSLSAGSETTVPNPSAMLIDIVVKNSTVV